MSTVRELKKTLCEEYALQEELIDLIEEILKDVHGDKASVYMEIFLRNINHYDDYGILMGYGWIKAQVARERAEIEKAIEK